MQGGQIRYAGRFKVSCPVTGLAQIFLSYAHADQRAVNSLAEALVQQGYTVWWDREIAAGVDFSLDIERELLAAEVVIVVWSEASVSSAWVKDEASLAQEQQKLLPISLHGIRPPLGYRQYQVLDLNGWPAGGASHGFQKLIDLLHERLDSSETMLLPNGASEPKGSVPADHGQRHICVLPFLNLSGDPEQDYFSDGITEDIITDLGKISTLGVVSRNTAFSFKHQSSTLAAVSAMTGATHVLEGSIRKSGKRVRITAQLVLARGDIQVWAERYDSTLDDIFSLQDTIAGAIVRALRLTLVAEEKQLMGQRSTTNSRAYQLYLMARQFLVLGNERHRSTIARICQEAVTEDPDYASAWAMLAIAQWELHRRNAANPDGRKSAETALALDPGLADAHAAMAAVYQEEGFYEKGLAASQMALEIDPDSYNGSRLAGFCALGLGNMGLAIKYFETAAGASDTEYHAAGMVIQCYEAQEDTQSTLSACRRLLTRVEQLIEQEPDHGSAIGYGIGALIRLGQEDRARDWADRAVLLDPDNINLHYGLACSMTSLGEHDQALDRLESIISDVSKGTLQWMAQDSDLEPLWQHPRFKAMMAEANGSEETG